MNDVIVLTMAYLASGLIVNHAQWITKMKDQFGEKGPDSDLYPVMIFLIFSSLAIFVVLFVLHTFGLVLPMHLAVLGMLGSIIGGFVAILLWRKIKTPVSIEIEITGRIVHERRIVTTLHTISVLAGCIGVGALLVVAHALIIGHDSAWRWYHGAVLIWLSGIFAIEWQKRTRTLIDLVEFEIKKR